MNLPRVFWAAHLEFVNSNDQPSAGYACIWMPRQSEWPFCCLQATKAQVRQPNSRSLMLHYENTPNQIYRKFNLQKLKICI